MLRGQQTVIILTLLGLCLDVSVASPDATCNGETDEGNSGTCSASTEGEIGDNLLQVTKH